MLNNQISSLIFRKIECCGCSYVSTLSNVFPDTEQLNKKKLKIIPLEVFFVATDCGFFKRFGVEEGLD